MSCGCKKDACEIDKVHDQVKDFYGKSVKATGDLQVMSKACALGETQMPAHVKEALSLVHDDITRRNFGCGLTIPDVLEGARVLDLGSGSGQDCYMLSKLVGQHGYVTGVDMTDEQLDLSRQYVQHHTEKFGYSKPNVEFVRGYIEQLGEAGVQNNSYDIIVSNCVINLSPDKRAVLREAIRVLKDGGEMYFSDIYSNKELSPEIRKDAALWGECIAGALCWTDLYEIAAEVGLSPPRLVTSHIFYTGDKQLEEVAGGVRFVSATFRLVKLSQERHPACHVMYQATVKGSEETFKLDIDNIFPRDESVAVDSEVATILKTSRLAKHFQFLDLQDSLPNKVVSHDPFAYADRTDQKVQVDDFCGVGCSPDATKTSGKSQGCCGSGSQPKSQSCCGSESQPKVQGCCGSGSQPKSQGCCKSENQPKSEDCCGSGNQPKSQSCCGSGN